MGSTLFLYLLKRNNSQLLSSNEWYYRYSRSHSRRPHLSVGKRCKLSRPFCSFRWEHKRNHSISNSICSTYSSCLKLSHNRLSNCNWLWSLQLSYERRKSYYFIHPWIRLRLRHLCSLIRQKKIFDRLLTYKLHNDSRNCVRSGLYFQMESQKHHWNFWSISSYSNSCSLSSWSAKSSNNNCRCSNW